MRLQKYELENERKDMQAKEWKQLLEPGKEKKTLFHEGKEGTKPCQHLEFLLLISKILKINLYCFKPLSLCYFVIAAVAN